MYWIITVLLLIFGLFKQNDALIVTAGLFAIASAIENFVYKYFKTK